MATRGSISKNTITKTLLKTFEGSFINDKNIVIPMREEGEELQIKVTLTCAKNSVAAPSITSQTSPSPSSAQHTKFSSPAPAASPSAEEKANIAKMLASLNL